MARTGFSEQRFRFNRYRSGIVAVIWSTGMIVHGFSAAAQSVDSEPIPPAELFDSEFICNARDQFRVHWQALEKDYGQVTGTLRFKKLRKSKNSAPAALLQLRSDDLQDYMGIELAKYFPDIDEIGISLHRKDDNGKKVLTPTGMAARKGDTVPFAMAWKRDEWLGVRIHKDKGWHNGELNFAATGLFLSCAAATVEFLELSVEEFETLPRRWRESLDAQPEEREEPGPGEDSEDEFRRDEPIINPTVTGMNRLRP